MDSISKRIGTREEVYKGSATRTAGGLKKDDIIEKSFGSKTIYISKKLSEKMRENFNIIKANNPNHLKRNTRHTMVIPKGNINESENSNTVNLVYQNKKNQNQKHNHQHAKTQKLSFNIKENTVRNVFYPELQGVDIKQLKEELINEEAEEDKGISLSSNQPKKEFSIEEMPDIDMASLS
jgi:hypothetical protein